MFTCSISRIYTLRAVSQPNHAHQIAAASEKYNIVRNMKDKRAQVVGSTHTPTDRDSETSRFAKLTHHTFCAWTSKLLSTQMPNLWTYIYILKCIRLLKRNQANWEENDDPLTYVWTFEQCMKYMTCLPSEKISNAKLSPQMCVDFFCVTLAMLQAESSNLENKVYLKGGRSALDA